MKKVLSALLTASLLFSGFSVAASSGDITDTAYYQPAQSLLDCQDQTPGNIPTEASADGVNCIGLNFANGVYLQEADGNIYWCGGRYLDKTKDTDWNAVFYTPASTAMGSNEGEWTVQSKVKFSQTTDGGVYNFGLRIGHGGGVNGRQMYFGSNSINTRDQKAESAIFTIEWQEKDSGVSRQSFNTDFSYALQNETWYVIRNTYNLDTKTARLDLYDATGETLLTSTGEISLPETIDAKNSSGDVVTKTIPYNLTFGGIRCDTNIMGGNYIGVDDFIITQTIAKPVTVTAGEGGTVTYGGKDVSGEVAVPYNSSEAQTFTIVPDEGYEIASIEQNGASVPATGTVSFENVKTAQTLNVAFRQKKPENPGIAENATTVQYGAVGEQPAVYVYSKLNNFTAESADEYGINLWIKGEADKLTLPAMQDSTTKAVAAANQAFAIKVFGKAITADQTYLAQPYVGEVTGTEQEINISTK